ncbi:MAG: ABC transporter ATP-binding protein [Firmicutes bacterium]|jgi:ABC-type multidrug transport system ATPase subunit|nr:ABC transporter ATP-binding protein [Bacillota bacterium]
MIQTEGLTKKFDGLTAVDNLNVHVEKGEIYGFLGPNGAGKTTTIMMLLGMERPTQGTIKLFGKDLAQSYFEIKRRVGVLSEFQFLYEDMTAKEYLRFFADLYEVENPDRKIDEVLSRIDLLDRQHELLSGYSKGMKQKLGMARVLLHDPDLLILDEPQSSLDPYGIKEIRDIIMEENSKGKTLFISSHILSEIERTCHRVGIIHHGKLLAEDDMTHLKQQVTSEMEIAVELEAYNDAIGGDLKEQEFVNSVTHEGNKLTIKTDVGEDHRAEISRIISSNGGVVLSMVAKEISLEEAFVIITEKNLSLLTKEGQAS